MIPESITDRVWVKIIDTTDIANVARAVVPQPPVKLRMANITKGMLKLSADARMFLLTIVPYI